MPKTRETFTLSGRLFIVAAPTLSHRFGTPPRRITLNSPDTNPDEFWESERVRQWRRLAPTHRATFTWPTPGELKNSNRPRAESWSVYRDQTSIRVPPPATDTGYKYTRLDAMDDTLSPSSPTSPTLVSRLGNMAIGAVTSPSVKEDELRCVHNGAFDNYCLLVFKASKVDHWVPGAIAPPVRTVYNCSKEGIWAEDELNP